MVRHVYDVARIADKAPAVLSASKAIFPALLIHEQREFSGQNPQFDADPTSCLKRAVDRAKTDDELRARYSDTLLPLVYEAHPPTFKQAFAAFEGVADELLRTL